MLCHPYISGGYQLPDRLTIITWSSSKHAHIWSHSVIYHTQNINKEFHSFKYRLQVDLMYGPFE